MIKAKAILENLEPYKTDYYKQNWDLKLDSNENIYGVSDIVKKALQTLDFEDISLYPCYGKLLDKLSKKYNLTPDNILLTNGCDEALSIIMNTYIDCGDELLSFAPTFSMPQLYAKANGAEIKTISYDEKFVFNPEKLQNAISSKTKIIYIASPNNPTGEVVEPNVIEKLLKNNPNILFTIDCTYTNFSTSVNFQDYLNLIKYDNAIVVKSFSKDFALAGLRLGFIATKEENISNLKKISSPYNVNIVAIRCATSVLEDDYYFEKIKELNNEVKEKLSKGLIDKGFKPYPCEGNFILCDFKNYSNYYFEKLRKNGIIVRKFSNPDLKGFLRITLPKIDGVDKILNLLEKKDVLIFDMDGVIFDVNQSYLEAIRETFKHFAGFEISIDEVNQAKSRGGLNCDWDATKYLLSQHGFEIELDEVIRVFQDLFYNPEIKNPPKDFLINKEKLLISKETFEKLSKKYDFVIFSGRLRQEALYSLQKEGIDKYFYYFVTMDDLPSDKLKPHPDGVLDILKHCPYKTIKYLGDSVDDVIAGNSANVDTIGVIAPKSDINSMTNNFKHLGAKYILNDIKEIVSFLKGIEK